MVEFSAPMMVLMKPTSPGSRIILPSLLMMDSVLCWWVMVLPEPPIINCCGPSVAVVAYQSFTNERVVSLATKNASPLVPELPDVPEEPLLPDEPLEPLVPLLPLEPEEPELPEVPLLPLEPEVPDEPATPLAPVRPLKVKFHTLYEPVEVEKF